MVTVEWLYDRGYVFSKVARQQIPMLMAGVDPGRIAERLRAKAEVIEKSELLTITPAEAGLVESVLRDPVEDRLILTSVSEHAIFGRKGGGDWDRVDFDGAGNIIGIALAPGSRVVWLASGHIDGSADEDSFRGLIGLDHANYQEIYIEAPEGVSFSDITVVEGETVFASDPVGGGVYRLSIEMPLAEKVVAPGIFCSPQGLAVSEDGELLYVSDYRYGIAVVDLETGEVSRLTTDLPLIVDGVDGMWRHGRELIVVQNGTCPMRISAFELSDDGREVIAYRVLEQAHSEWTEPLSGNVDGHRLIYVVNGQWDRLVAGKLASDEAPLPSQIRTLPLDQK